MTNLDNLIAAIHNDFKRRKENVIMWNRRLHKTHETESGLEKLDQEMNQTIENVLKNTIGR